MMNRMTVTQLYRQHIQPLSITERLQLVVLITQELSILPTLDTARPRSLLELEGLGAEMWAGVEAQEYVNDLRQEWDHRP